MLAIALVLGVWELITLSGWKHYVLKGPGPVFANLWDQAVHGNLWSIIGATLQSAVVGYALALVIGTVLGLLVSRIPPLRAAVGSIITGLQTMPSIAWVPFAIIIFGENSSAILFVVILGAAPSIANGLITGVDYTPPLLLRAGRTMGLRGFALYRFLILPASLPAYVAGMKQGWAFAWRSLMAGELVVQIIGQFSIGQQLSVDQQNLDFAGATRHDHRDPGHRDRGGHHLHQGRPGHPAPPRPAGGKPAAAGIRQVRRHAGDAGITAVVPARVAG